MPDSEMPKTIAEHMRARGKPDDQIRDTLQAWHLGGPAIDDLMANLPPPPGDPTTPANARETAVDLAANMRNDGRPDDLIRDSLRAMGHVDGEIDDILAAAPPRGKPVSHEIVQKSRPFNLFADVMRRLDWHIW